MNEIKIKVGIISGTGFTNSLVLEKRIDKHVNTPYGKPSDVIVEGVISNVPCAILSRHGKDHSINPSNINYRANIWALKSVGCTHILAQTSCGSLQHDIKPGDFLVIDQFFDRTTLRIQTFYDGNIGSPEGIVHIPMDSPFCEKTRKMLIEAAEKVAGKVHKFGSIVTIEGNRFSSKFESKYFHQLGLSVINMTTVPEVVLAKELGISYASLAVVTDYDSWRDSGDSVDASSVVRMAKDRMGLTNRIIVEALRLIAKEQWDDVIKQNKDLVANNKL